MIGSRDGMVYRLDHAGKEIWNYDTGGTVLGLGVTADGKLTVAGTEGRSAFLLDETGKPVWQKDYDFVVQNAAIAGDGSLIALVLTKDKQVLVLDQAGNEKWSVKFEVSPTSAAISEDGQRLAFGTRDAYVHLYDAAGNLLWKQQMDGLIAGVALSKDGSYLAVADESSKAYLLKGQIEPGKRDSIVWSYKMGGKGTAAGITGDGGTVAAGSRDKNAYMLDGAGKLLSKYRHRRRGQSRWRFLPTAARWLSVPRTARPMASTSPNRPPDMRPSSRRKRALSIAMPCRARHARRCSSVVFLRFVPVGQRLWARYGARPRKLARESGAPRLSYLLLLPTVAAAADVQLLSRHSRACSTRSPTGSPASPRSGSA